MTKKKRQIELQFGHIELDGKLVAIHMLEEWPMNKAAESY